jgi:hypothetical protein
MLSQGDYADWMTYKTCQKINGAWVNRSWHHFL